MNKNNLNEFMKYIENFDEDFSASDFLPSEIREKDKNFKTKYFEFYDDIKSHTNPKQDWWNMDINQRILAELKNLKDEKFQKFSAKLIPNIEQNLVLGVKSPLLKNLAKSLMQDPEIDKFLNNLPHKYLEENLLHCYIISNIKDFEKCTKQIEKFLSYLNNWEVTDILRPKCFKSHQKALISYIHKWLNNNNLFAKRLTIGLLMAYFLDEYFNKEYLTLVASKCCDDYYLNMMIAWYFSTALVKQWNDTIKILENKTLPIWVHNKTIQKTIESFRITKEQKEYLKTLKIKTHD